MEDSSIQHPNETVREDHENTFSNKCSRIKRQLIVLCLICGISWIIIDSAKFGYTKSLANDFFTWLSDNPGIGTFAFIVIYAIATAILFVPGSILTIGAGFAFAMAFGDEVGLLVSSVAVFIGASIGSIVAFFLARYVMKDTVTPKLREKYVMFKAIDAAIEKNGFKIMCLLRLSPVIPFNILGYLSGSTSISIGKYTLALVGMIPGVILYCAVGVIGCTLSNNHDSSEHIVSFIVGIIFAIGSLFLTSYYAKKELRHILSLEEGDTSESEDIANDSSDEELGVVSTSSDDSRS